MEILRDRFLCFPSFPWVCGAESAKYAVGGNGCEVRVRRQVRKEEREKLQGVSVCAP